MSVFVTMLLSLMLWQGISFAGEVPISGMITHVDANAQTMTIEATAKGKSRVVTVEIKPTSRIVRFSRPSEPNKSGFVEQTASLAELKAGWVVSVTSRHEGDREVADEVKVVFER